MDSLRWGPKSVAVSPADKRARFSPAHRQSPIGRKRPGAASVAGSNPNSGGPSVAQLLCGLCGGRGLGAVLLRVRHGRWSGAYAAYIVPQGGDRYGHHQSSATRSALPGKRSS